MFKNLLLIFGTCTLVLPSFAGSYDACSQLPGHWQGIYNLKNNSECMERAGCAHLLQADVKDLKDNNYQVRLKPVVGQGGIFSITCQDGVISSPVNVGNTVRFECDAEGHCTLVYEDARLSAEAIKG